MDFGEIITQFQYEYYFQHIRTATFVARVPECVFIDSKDDKMTDEVVGMKCCATSFLNNLNLSEV
jgi:hypothetical protein